MGLIRGLIQEGAQFRQIQRGGGGSDNDRSGFDRFGGRDRLDRDSYDSDPRRGFGRRRDEEYGYSDGFRSRLGDPRDSGYSSYGGRRSYGDYGFDERRGDRRENYSWSDRRDERRSYDERRDYDRRNDHGRYGQSNEPQPPAPHAPYGGSQPSSSSYSKEKPRSYNPYERSPSREYDNRGEGSSSQFDLPPSYEQAAASPGSRDYPREKRAPPPEIAYPPYDDGYSQPQNQVYSSPSPSRSLSSIDGPLPVPVIIPPQRPGNVGRGFRPAYAASLQAGGIDQVTFMTFLNDLNKGCQDHKALMPLQVACFGAGLAPSMIATAVTMGVSKASTVANGKYVQSKVNKVLDKYNEELFSPNGMYVMIMKYDPMMGQMGSGGRRGGRQGGLISKVGGAVGSMASSQMGGRDGGSSWSRDYTSGSTGADTLPTEVAPLVFLDNDPEYQQMASGSKSPSPEKEGESSSSWMKKTGSKASSAMAGLNNYLDKRARANYIAENGENVLTVGDPDALRRAGGSGSSSPFGRDRGRDRDNGRDSEYEKEVRKEMRDYEKERRHIIDDRRDRWETEERLRELDEKMDQKMAELENNRQNGGNKRKITENVLYLMVVNRPSDAQLASAEARMDQTPVTMTTV